MHIRRTRRAQSKKKMMIFIFIWVITWMLSVRLCPSSDMNKLLYTSPITMHVMCLGLRLKTVGCYIYRATMPLLVMTWVFEYSVNTHWPLFFAGHDMSIEYLVNTHWPLFTAACNTPHSTNPYPSCMTASRSRTSWSQPAGLFHRSQVVRQFSLWVYICKCS